MTEGQQRALRQLRSVQAARPGGLEVLDVVAPEAAGGAAIVEVSLDCAGVAHVPDGIRLRGRERLRLSIPARFPLVAPKVTTPHTRWRGTPHVQWGRSICLYASPASEWLPADGIFGFLDRLWDWLQAASLDQLDPDGVPLHPPVAYTAPDAPLIIPRADTPPVEDGPWLGWANTVPVHPRRVDLTAWTPMTTAGTLQDAPGHPAAAFLLPGRLDWEYPITAAGLLLALLDRGVSWSDLWLLLGLTALERPGEPALVVVGTAMRGLRGGTPRQHLTAWRIPAQTADDLWKSLAGLSTSAERRRLGEASRDRVLTWASQAPTEWCPVREARAEVTIRRDTGSPLRWFAGKTVAIWGCGAIGSPVAEWLTRAGVARMILRDNAGVAPGVLVRQGYIDADLGYRKAEMLGKRLQAIAPGLQLHAHYGDVLNGPLLHGPWHENADLVIDATASSIVATAAERVRRDDPSRPIAALLFGHTAEHGIGVLCPAGDSAGLTDALRAAKLVACANRTLYRFRDEFWPDPPRADLFQPEPGCSDPTFTGSAVEAAGLAAGLLRAVARDLVDGGASRALHFMALDGADGKGAQQRRVTTAASWDVVLPDGLAVRLSDRTLEGMRREVVASAGLRGAASETGGLLFGERDDAAGVLWVDEASPPPPDSRHAPEEFVCGTRGVVRTVADHRRRGRGSLELVGTWHTHPVTGARPSARDLVGMAELLDAAASPLAQALLLIVGRSSGPRPSLGAYLFERSELGADVITIVGDQRRLARAVWPPLAAVERAPAGE